MSCCPLFFSLFFLFSVDADKLVQPLLSDCVVYSKEKCLLDMVTLISGMKRCGGSYEAE